jgi:phosphoribosylformylglycinamidine cyclo-ligase
MYLVNAASLFLRLLDKSGLNLSDPLPRNDGISTTVGGALMTPTVIYVKQVGFCLFIYILYL